MAGLLDAQLSPLIVRVAPPLILPTLGIGALVLNRLMTRLVARLGHDACAEAVGA